MKTILLLILFMLPALADAEVVTTQCGEAGTGKLADGRTVTRTADEAAGTRVKEDGYWWTCRTVQPALIQPPKDCYPQSQGFRTWTTDGHACTTALRSATSATNPARDRVIRHGRIEIWRQWTGPMRGMLIERCVDGSRSMVTSTCEPVRECDTKWSISSDGGKTVFTYDARPRDARVPVGEYAEATTPAGRTMRIQCVQGEFKRAR